MSVSQVAHFQITLIELVFIVLSIRSFNVHGRVLVPRDVP